MAKKVPQREDLIDALDDIEVLRERLKAAERACVLFGWSAIPDRDRARGRLSYRAWSDWYNLIGGADVGGPKANDEINKEVLWEERRDREMA
jgi:hypothetical protein